MIMGFLFSFFVIPFLIFFFLFIVMEIILIPIIFLFSSIVALMLFTGIYFWIFFALALASLLYLALYLGNLLCKGFIDKKFIKFLTVTVVVFIILGLIHKRIVHTEMQIIDNETGEQKIILENFIN